MVLNLWLRLAIIGGIVLGGLIAFILGFYYVYGYRSKKAKTFVAIAALLSLASFWLIIYLSYQLDIVAHASLFHVLRNIGFLAYGWAAMVYIVIIPLVIVGIIRYFVMRRATKVAPELASSRRKLFKRTALAIPLVTFGGTTALALNSDKEQKVRHITLKYPKLPGFMKGLKVGQISDLHLGPYASFAILNQTFATFAKEGVQRVFITGDLIDEIPMVPTLVKIINEWAPQFPQGIDYIYGNHEYYRDLDLIEKNFAKANMRIHRNSNIKVADGDWPVYIVGVDFPFGRALVKEKIEAYLDEAMEGVPQEAFTILLAHHPDFIGAAFEKKIPITFAGHSHGGQLNIFHSSIVPMDYDYWRGLYKAKINDNAQRYGDTMMGYVSTGAGDWFPMRMNCPREVTIFTFLEGVDHNSANEYE